MLIVIIRCGAAHWLLQTCFILCQGVDFCYFRRNRFLWLLYKGQHVRLQSEEKYSLITSFKVVNQSKFKFLLEVFWMEAYKIIGCVQSAFSANSLILWQLLCVKRIQRPAKAIFVLSLKLLSSNIYIILERFNCGSIAFFFVYFTNILRCFPTILTSTKGLLQ